METSEFGRGFTYNIALFLMHRDRIMDVSVHIWFSGSSDHLVELQIPQHYPEAFKKRIAAFRYKCLELAHSRFTSYPTMEDAEWVIKEAKEILIVVDSGLGVEVCKGGWE